MVWMSNILERLGLSGWFKPVENTAQRHGVIGEKAARRHLELAGLRFLTANYRTKRGEIDLIFRDEDCLVFVEVKTRSSEEWTRPAAAVNAAKRRKIARTAMDYLAELGKPSLKLRFDIVEVLLEDESPVEVRHLANTFELPRPLRYN